MSDHLKMFQNLIKDVEGFEPRVYKDTKQNPTIGSGLNLNDPTVQGLMHLRGIDPHQVSSGQMHVDPKQLEEIHNAYIQKREPLIKSKFGEDLYDTLSPNEKAAVLSLGYQSLNNLGPNLIGRIAEGDKIGAIREMLLGTNKDKDPGIMSRRLKEAELFGGPMDFAGSFKTMNTEEKKKILDTINKTKNENTRSELMAKYAPYMQEMQQQSSFQKLFKPELPPVQPQIPNEEQLKAIKIAGND